MILVSLSEEMKNKVGRTYLLVQGSAYKQVYDTVAYIKWGTKWYRGIIHTAKDGLHWTEIIAEA